MRRNVVLVPLHFLVPSDKMSRGPEVYRTSPDWTRKARTWSGGITAYLSFRVISGNKGVLT